MAAVTQEELTALRTQIAQLQENQADLRKEVDVLKSSEAGLHAALADLQNAATIDPAGERLKEVEVCQRSLPRRSSSTIWTS